MTREDRYDRQSHIMVKLVALLRGAIAHFFIHEVQIRSIHVAKGLLSRTIPFALFVFSTCRFR